MLEVSNIAKEIIGESGVRAYQVGTRTASTTLQLKDGETQVLAGLIKNEAMNSESRVPGLGSIPGIRHLFTNENSTRKKSELILLLTPRIVRNANYPDFYESEFYSGTKDRLSLQPPALGESTEYATTPPAHDDPATRGAHEQTWSDSTPAIAPLSVPTAGAEARLTLVAPHAVAAGQDFDVPIALDSAYTNPLSFSLSSSSKSLEILSIAPMIGERELTQTTDAQRAAFTLHKSSTTRNSDILAIARIRALTTTHAETVRLELKPEREENLDSLPVQGSSQEIRIEAVASSEDPGIDMPPAIDSAP
ncbi:type II secretion system protein D [compost metagenome]